MHRHRSVAHAAQVHEHTFKHSSLVFLDKTAIRFIPRENGVHSIDVKFNGCHIPGSPFNVRVGDPGLIGDPGLVTAHGPGLQGGTTGRYHHPLQMLSSIKRQLLVVIIPTLSVQTVPPLPPSRF